MAEWIVEANSLGDLVEGLWVGGKRLVRCRECKHYHKTTCPFLIANAYKLSADDDFCSRGKRHEV